MASGDPPWMKSLDGVDWASVDHAYGPASDVPEMIRTLAGGKEADAFEALETLSNTLNHQGSIYPATAPALPFLIEALRAPGPGTRVRLGLLSLVGGIAEGGVQWIDEKESGGLSVPELVAAVWRGSDVYASLLAQDPDPDVRMHAAHVLGLLASLGPTRQPPGITIDHGRVLSGLFSRLAEERDPLTLSSSVFALGSAIPHDPRIRPVLRHVLGRTGKEEAPRVAAALALVEADGERHEEETAAALLIEAMSRGAATDLLFQPRTGGSKEDIRYLPWFVGKLRFRLCRALCDWSAADDGRMSRVLPALLVGVRAAGEYTAESDIGPVLHWLWPGRTIRFEKKSDGKMERVLPPPVTSGELKGLKRTVVEACYENASIWNPRNGNVSLTFMRVGLPDSRAELGRLLGKG